MPHACQNGNHQEAKKQVLERMWSKAGPHALLVGTSVGASIVENRMETTPKVKIELTCDQAISLLGIHLKKTKTLI